MDGTSKSSRIRLPWQIELLGRRGEPSVHELEHAVRVDLAIVEGVSSSGARSLSYAADSAAADFEGDEQRDGK